MKVSIKFSINFGTEKPTAPPVPTGPDTQAQIGTHHDAGYTDTGLGFQTPATTPYEEEDRG